ncbi:MAG: S9 family peptidase [Deltaproteobacteria bacterium]|nr:S9 family peptidase [Deltaproteobacteria bacterium]
MPLAPLVLAAGLVASSAFAQDPHPLTVHDLVAFDRLSDPQVSPDGRRVVYVLSRLDLEANRRRADLWLTRIDGGEPRRLTTHEAGASDPRWSPDGHWVYFLTGRSGTSQVWRLPVDGGEAQPVTSLPLDVHGYLLAPDGATLLVAMDVFVDADGPDATAKRLEAVAAEKATGHLYDRLLFRHWDAWWDGRRSHLFAVPIAGGAPVDVMKGMDADAPSKPFGGMEEVAFAPQGRGVVFAARHVGREEAWSTDFDLWYAPLDGSAPPRELTPGNPAWDTAPAFSPDGKTLAYLAMQVPGYEADRFRVVLRDGIDGPDRVLTEAWDRSPGSLLWAPDGRTIYAVAEDHGQRVLFAIDARSGAVRPLVGGGTVRSPELAGDRILFARDSLSSPVDLFTLPRKGGKERRVTHVNRDRLAAVRMGAVSRLVFEGWNGEPVEGWVLKPANVDPAKRYPVAFLIHGGPQGAWGDDFHYRWNPQTYTGAGYGVVMVDFHGSTGYGQAFTDAIAGDWGGKPLTDLQKGLEAALAQNPWMDGDRVCALGASFGGYMINWISGAWPDRFRCLVVHDGNLDERAAYYDTEELWFPEHDHGGTPWDHPEGYAKHNPIDLVGKWRTPTLVIHGGRDFRVVDTQGMMTFTALQRRKIPSKFLHFPDENHWVLKPANSILWHETVLAWLDEWTRSASR